MRVQDIMCSAITTCKIDDNLESAARVLWECDCGTAPVVDERGHVHGMITDRDICMATYTTGRLLRDLKVRDAMSTHVATARPTDSLQEAQMVMRAHGVRRLPVIDAQKRLVGILSFNDLCRWVDDGGANGATPHDATYLVRSIAEVGKVRGGKGANVRTPAPTTQATQPTSTAARTHPANATPATATHAAATFPLPRGAGVHRTMGAEVDLIAPLPASNRPR